MLNKANIYQLRKKKILYLFNNLRGIKVFQYLYKKKKIKNYEILIARKFLNKKILTVLKKMKLKFNIIELPKNNSKILKKLVLCDFVVVCGFPYILNHKIIQTSRNGIINCHAGKLPEYRGGSPLNWQLINNEKNFGISVIKINNTIDGGDIIEERKFNLKRKYTINNLHQIANNHFPKMVFLSLIKLLNNFKTIKQNNRKAKVYRQRNSKDSYLNFKNMNYNKIDCFVRALQSPYPFSFFLYKNFKYEIIKIKKINLRLSPGKILKKNNRIFFGCKNASIEIIKYRLSKEKLVFS